MLGVTGTASAETRTPNSLFEYLFSASNTVLIYDGALHGEDALAQVCASFPRFSSDSSWCDRLWGNAHGVAELGEPNGQCLFVYWNPWDLPPTTVNYQPCKSTA